MVYLFGFGFNLKVKNRLLIIRGQFIFMLRGRYLKLFLFSNKKGVTELTSFVLLTFLITVAATSAYVFSKDFMEDNLAVLDLDNMDTYLIEFSQRSEEIMNFQDAQSVVNVEFKTGQLSFISNQIKFQSLVEYSGEEVCFSELCSKSIGGYELYFMNLSNSYIFKNNLSLGPGSYRIVLVNIKKKKKITVKLS